MLKSGTGKERKEGNWVEGVWRGAARGEEKTLQRIKAKCGTGATKEK